MFVSLVSLRRRHAAIAADILEATTATDALGTGAVILVTLIDDPANVDDIVDAFIGELLYEAASASDTISAGLSYLVLLDEPASAQDMVELRGTATLSADVVEAAGAADVPDGTVPVAA